MNRIIAKYEVGVSLSQEPRTTAAGKEEKLQAFSGIHIGYHAFPAGQWVFTCS
jgi:hypothetical protein